jgi:lysophospholipase L1-like esterase
MARKHQSPFERTLRALVLSFLTVAAVVAAQDVARDRAAAEAAPAQAPSQPAPAPYSRDCQIGSTAIVEESALPHVAAALQSRKQIKILAIGASPIMSRRVNGGHGETMRQLLKQAVQGLDVVMINRGVSGELSAQAAVRIKNEVALNEPDLVLWQVGTNDALAYVPLDEFQNTVEDTLAWLKQHKIDVVLVGLQYVGQMALDDNYRAVRDLLRKIAAKENVMIVRRYEAQQFLARAEEGGGGLVPDEFERTEAGYICLAQYMTRAITLGVFGHKFKAMLSPSAVSPPAVQPSAPQSAPAPEPAEPQR